MDPAKFVTYIAADSAHKNLVFVNSMSCVDAERFRERLFVSMDRGIYESEDMIRSSLVDASASLQQLETSLAAEIDATQVKALVLGSATVVSTVYAISTTAACASAVINGGGIAACGPAARGSVAAVAAWAAFSSTMESAGNLKALAIKEIDKQRGIVTGLEQQLNAAMADSMRVNYSNLFVAICTAVREQCLK
ncbi:hypothetical protein [Agrobacterium vitis]|uniref:Uncharacterized protein n=1 Tax=Agrobacterium vitis TaxID=373 RepID=A0AAE4W8R9_AGRVI|nr:hypothetical protein [Agrobacterium vitis]MCF1497822.1 hypothetical protein [Allorhizobium sp. Av2]MUZ55962.1 hypothetical protein [Agrobacterium vitis]MVA64900.1 hypothetical protein [Agrobacterium vitis]MVA85871.1 hypothetical protein [Agrobacterium vitis]